ncbi:MAG: hypothetical protein IT425_14630 [Pirellulales bacterium]|nr:hypothetical protein [Pirellulales bacterium]
MSEGSRSMSPVFSKQRIKASFDVSGLRIWTRQALLQFIDVNRPEWEIEGTQDETESAPFSTTRLINWLVKETPLQSIKLDFPYRGVTRFTWGDPPTFRIIQSVDAKGYFSHYTAMQIHNLTDQIPKSVYFNVEQPAAGGGGSLTQTGIDRAFKGKCRVTNNVTEFRGLTIHKINGQNTGRLGVVEQQMEVGSSIQVTNLERTLIDIAVRPIYSGGIAEVANAYRAAAGKVSGNRIATYLKTLNYTYPYHQVIGYYMTRAGNYSEAQVAKLRKLPKDFDFYLTYQLKNPVLDKKWRLYVPKGF